MPRLNKGGKKGWVGEPACSWTFGDLFHHDEVSKYYASDGLKGMRHAPLWTVEEKYRPCGLHVVVLRFLGTLITRELTLAEAIDKYHADVAKAVDARYAKITPVLTRMLFDSRMLAIRSYKNSQYHIRQMDGEMARARQRRTFRDRERDERYGREREREKERERESSVQRQYRFGIFPYGILRVV